MNIAAPVGFLPPVFFPPEVGLKNPANICAVTGLDDSSDDEGKTMDPGGISKFLPAPGSADGVEAAVMVSLVEDNEPAFKTVSALVLVMVSATGTDTGELFVAGDSGRNDFQSNAGPGSVANSNRIGAGPMLGR